MKLCEFCFITIGGADWENKNLCSYEGLERHNLVIPVIMFFRNHAENPKSLKETVALLSQSVFICVHIENQAQVKIFPAI